jgi:CII-binding regulator of phage lambda lysogenization HflD
MGMGSYYASFYRQKRIRDAKKVVGPTQSVQRQTSDSLKQGIEALENALNEDDDTLIDRLSEVNEMIQDSRQVQGSKLGKEDLSKLEKALEAWVWEVENLETVVNKLDFEHVEAEKLADKTGKEADGTAAAYALGNLVDTERDLMHARDRVKLLTNKINEIKNSKQVQGTLSKSPSLTGSR